MRSLLAVLLLAFACLGLSADVPVYPGAVLEEQVSKSIRKSNPENAAYNTADSFDKVDAFYKKAGSEDVPHSRNIHADMKMLVLRFPGKKFQVGLSWNAADKMHGTVIQIFSKP